MTEHSCATAAASSKVSAGPENDDAGVEGNDPERDPEGASPARAATAAAAAPDTLAASGLGADGLTPPGPCSSSTGSAVRGSTGTRRSSTCRAAACPAADDSSPDAPTLRMLCVLCTFVLPLRTGRATCRRGGSTCRAQASAPSICSQSDVTAAETPGFPLGRTARRGSKHWSRTTGRGICEDDKTGKNVTIVYDLSQHRYGADVPYASPSEGACNSTAGVPVNHEDGR